jgi:predicted Fe-Mo cluster-binding NifX family protein
MNVSLERDLLIAFGTDDGESLNDDHVGMAKYFYVYRFIGEKEEFVEKRENVKFKGDESIKHGDPEKARATSSVLEGIDVLVGRKFGPNIVRLLKKFVCVVVRKGDINNAIEMICCNKEKIVEQWNKEENRKHLVL